MVDRNRFIGTLLLAGVLGGAVACSHDAPRADEALLIRPGVTSGGTGMGGVEPTLAPQALHGTSSVSLGSTYDPGTGSAASNATTVRTDANGNTVVLISGPTPQPAPTNTAYGTAPGTSTAGTVNGNYGPLPTTGVGATTAPSNLGANGVITH